MKMKNLLIAVVFLAIQSLAVSSKGVARLQDRCSERQPLVGKRYYFVFNVRGDKKIQDLSFSTVFWPLTITC